MTDARIVLTTLDDLDKAKQLGRKLVEQRLAACVNLVERVHSIYRWQGHVESADEILLIIKTSAERIPALRAAMERLHPYELPEFLILEVSGGSEAYMAWLLEASGKNAKLP